MNIIKKLVCKLMYKAKPCIQRHKRLCTCLLLLALFLWLGSWMWKCHYVDYVYNILPSAAENYVLIIPNYTSSSGKAVEVTITDALTHKEVEDTVEYLEDYDQYAALLKKGVYSVIVHYGDGRSWEEQLRIVPGKEVYLLWLRKLERVN